MVTAGTQSAPVKSSLLNQLPVVNVGIAVPELINRLGELKVEPPVVPNVYVLVINASETNPPVTLEKLKLVASATDNTVVAAVVDAKIILLLTNTIERLVVPELLNAPTVKSNPPRFNIPATTLQTDVAVYVCVPSNVSVWNSPLTPIPPNTLLN